MKRSFISILITAALFICIKECKGQNINFQSYTSAQGLSQNSIYSIAQTKEGFMWFGTQDGINRFDGRNFNTIIPDTKDSTTNHIGKFSKMITALYADNDDWLWVGTTHEIVLYNRYTNKFILPAEVYSGFSIPRGTYIKKVVEDHQENIWILTQEYGLFCYSKSVKKMMPLFWQEAPRKNITTLCINKSGDIWISSQDEIYRLDNKIFYPAGLQKLLPGKKTFVFEMNMVNNQVWFITATSDIFILNEFNKNNYEVINFSKEFKGSRMLADARLIHQSDSNTVWIGSRSEGLIKINIIKKTFEKAPATGAGNSLNSSFVLSFFTNAQAITWIGLSGGIAKYDLHKTQFGLWRNEPLPDKPKPDNKLLSVFSKNDEDFFIGTLNGGLLKKNIKTSAYQYYQPVKFLKDNPESKNIYQVIAGENNLLWMATWGGLYSFDDKTKYFSLYNDPNNEQTKQLCAVIKLKEQNKLLAGGYKGGLCLFNLNTKNWEPFKDIKNVLTNSRPLRVRYMKEMEEGDIYMSTEAQNLVKYNYHSGEFTFFPQFQEISGDSRYFCFDNSYLWVGTTDGLIQADKKTMQLIKVWNTSNGLPNNYIYAVVPDNYGHIWISSNDGLAMLDYNSGICKKFTEEDGLQSKEFNTASCYKDKDGKIWFGGINGLNMVNPSLTTINSYSPAPLIINITVMNSPYQSDTAIPYLHSITLPYYRNFISFEFQSPNFSQSENTIYEYMLKGVDTGWVNNNTRTYASYTQLNPGKYFFLIRSANTNYVWSKNFTSIEIIIIPPWYRTWWFYLLSLLLIASFFFFIIQQRIKAIRFRAEAKQKMAETEMAALKAQMNPHFMFNCINSIDSFIQSNDKYNATLYLNKFAKLIRNVLDSSKENAVTFSKDITTLKLYLELEELRCDNKFKVQLNIDEELMSSDYKVPPLIIQPFVENAIVHGLKNKESADGLLEIKVEKKEDEIIYSITDNGIGRKAAEKINTGKEKSYGMEMSFERIRLFNKESNASVSIMDNENMTGTIVTVHLKIV